MKYYTVKISSLTNILSTTVLKQDESVVSFDVPILYEK